VDIRDDVQSHVSETSGARAASRRRT
jgi:hypothetical protein